MIFKKKDLSQQQLIDLHLETLEKSNLKVGDVVRMKGGEFTPKMVITSKSIKINSVFHLETDEIFVIYETQWFNKSKQDFTTKWFIEECLEKL